MPTAPATTPEGLTRPPQEHGVPSRPLRVLLVVDSLDIGGAERYVVDLAVALRRRGCHVLVACSAGGPLARELDREGLAVRPLLGRLVKRRFDASYARAIRELVVAEGFDLVHAHVYASQCAAAVAVLGLGVPLVLTEHSEGPWRSPRAIRMSAWTYGRAAHVMVVSHAIRRRLLDGFGVPAERVSFVQNAVVVRHPPAAIRTAGAGPVIGRVARLQPEKGVDVFLRAAAILSVRIPDALFVVVGDGPLRADLTELAGQLRLDGRVRFLGGVDDARQLIDRMDVMAVSSRTDGSPLVVLEAMAAGVPVVASAVGGIPDQVRHGRDGLLVPPGDPAALAHALARLVEDDAVRRRLGDAARRRSARLFSHTALVDHVELVYADVLARSRRRG